MLTHESCIHYQPVSSSTGRCPVLRQFSTLHFDVRIEAVIVRGDGDCASCPEYSPAPDSDRPADIDDAAITTAAERIAEISRAGIEA